LERQSSKSIRGQGFCANESCPQLPGGEISFAFDDAQCCLPGREDFNAVRPHSHAAHTHSVVDMLVGSTTASDLTIFNSLICQPVSAALAVTYDTQSGALRRAAD
jgi:hypothetical protein